MHCYRSVVVGERFERCYTLPPTPAFFYTISVTGSCFQFCVRAHSWVARISQPWEQSCMEVAANNGSFLMSQPPILYLVTELLTLFVCRCFLLFWLKKKTTARVALFLLVYFCCLFVLLASEIPAGCKLTAVFISKSVSPCLILNYV